jgi:DNA primase
LARSIPDEIIRRVKNQANIVDIIGEYVVLKKSGRNFLGLCPFHAEKTPSFSVSPEKEIFYCFGCHSGGNIFSFLMQHQGLSFPEAVRNLAGRFGIDIPSEPLSPTQTRQLSEKEKLYQINGQALTYFRRCLQNREYGQRAMSYLLGRGMTRNIIDGFSLGYAPKKWDSLLRYFQSKNTTEKTLVKTGLIVPRKDQSGYYDRFRDRIMFPIFDSSSQIIGFGGRLMDDGLPKYLNSPESVVFNKRRSLYGIEKARSPARRTNRVHVVEGYFDVMAMHLYGLENTVATLGTALSSEHVQVLKGLVGHQGQVILVFDSDQAGIKAAQRSIHIFEQGFVDARILVLPQGYDPDLYLREQGPEVFQQASERALAMIPFLMASAINEYGLSIEGKVKIIKSLKESLVAVQDPVARSLYIQELAERLGVAESAIMEQVRQTRSTTTAAHPPKNTPGRFDGLRNPKRLEESIIAMMLHYSAMIPDIKNSHIMDYFEDDDLRHIAMTILESYGRSAGGSIAALVTEIEDPRQRSLLTRLAMAEEHWDREDCERLLAQFEMRYQRRMGEDLQREIENAEKNDDYELLARLLRQKQKQAGKGLTHL